jgi:hypothetical protein
MKREQVEQFLLSKGYKMDRFGHFKTESGNTRIKMQARSLRIEKKVNHPAGLYSSASSSWVKTSGGYYSELSIKDDKLSGLKP